MAKFKTNLNGMWDDIMAPVTDTEEELSNDEPDEDIEEGKAATPQATATADTELSDLEVTSSSSEDEDDQPTESKRVKQVSQIDRVMQINFFIKWPLAFNVCV